MDQFLENCNLLLLSKGKVENLSSTVPIKEIEFLIRKPPKRKYAIPYSLTCKNYQTCFKVNTSFTQSLPAK